MKALPGESKRIDVSGGGWRVALVLAGLRVAPLAGWTLFMLWIAASRYETGNGHWILGLFGIYEPVYGTQVVSAPAWVFVLLMSLFGVVCWMGGRVNGFRNG